MFILGEYHEGLKVVGIIAGITIVGCIAFFSVKEYVNSKEDSNYVLNYIKEHKDDKTTSLIVKRNGETLTSINEKKTTASKYVENHYSN